MKEETGEAKHSEEQAIKRLKEETGLDGKVTAKTDFPLAWAKKDTVYYYTVTAVKVNSKQKISLNSKEHDGFEWVPESKVKEKLTYEQSRELFDISFKLEFNFVLF
ncbi:MAG: NUDIX domain-containing protein [Candidatus Diapherotrites archaeon]